MKFRIKVSSCGPVIIKGKILNHLISVVRGGGRDPKQVCLVLHPRGRLS